MERAQGPRTPYEVYCYHCRVTFPREARQCVHCGGRLSQPGSASGSETISAAPASPELRADPSVRAEPTRRRPTPADLDPEPDEELDTGSALLRRFGGLAVWAMLALAAVVARLCEGG